MTSVKVYPLAILAIGGLLLTAGDVVFKTWTRNNQPMLYASGLALYIVGLMFLVASYRYTNIAVASAIFVLSNLVFLAIVSWLWFKEPLNVAQMVGMACALGAVVMFELA